MKLNIKFKKINLPVNYEELNQYQRRGVRIEYINVQNGKCHYCKNHLLEEPTKNKVINIKLFPENFFKHGIHLHHDHNTGMTIGAVHAYCNAVLFQYHGE